MAVERQVNRSATTGFATHGRLPRTASVLVIEDDPVLGSVLAGNLREQGYRVTTARDRTEGLMAARFHRPDVIVIDLTFPSGASLDACRQLRRWSSAPILVLTSFDREQEVVAALDSGADDCVTKPFRMLEVLARVRALLRRAQVTESESEVLTVGGLTVNRLEYRATFYGRPLRLPPKSFEILAAMAQKPGRVFTRAELIDLVWGEEIVIDPRNIDVHIRWIRAQLEGEPDGSPLIQTVHGVGYRFAAEPHQAFAGSESLRRKST